MRRAFPISLVHAAGPKAAATACATAFAVFGLVAPLAAQGTAPAPAAAFVGAPVASIALKLEERPTADPGLLDLVETRVGEPLSMSAVRETLMHLFSLGRFQAIEVNAESVAGGAVALEYRLTPLHGVADVRIRGESGVSGGDLRRLVVERFGQAPPVGRADAAARLLEQHLARNGFPRARVKPSIEVRHDPDRTILNFDVQAGPRARIGSVRISGIPNTRAVAARLGLTTGQPYAEERLQQRLDEYLQSLRRRGFYEATADHRPQPREDSTVVDVTLEIRPGPSVRLAFEGNPLPRNRIEELVPVAREGSVDEDLLEDSEVRIRNFLLEQGYWKAEVSHRREQAEGVETVTFSVNRGARYTIDAIEISGNASVGIAELRALVPIRPGEPFVEGRLTSAVEAIKALYQRRGFASAAVEVATDETPASAAGEGSVQVRLAIREGVLTRIRAIAIEGNAALSDARLRGVMALAPGDPYYVPAVAAAREKVLVEYLDNGYAAATVAVDTPLSADRSAVDLTFRVVEGTQVIVDHVMVIGNTRTSEETIRRELLIQPGQPLGLADLVESQRRLSALGLFRRVRITEVAHSDQPRRDVIVAVEEANRTTMAFGAGVELIPKVGLSQDVSAVERYDIAPRGSFEIGRRNLWGRNRSVNLFTRISFRPRGESLESPGSAQYGFNEYRAVATYREIGAFESNADVAMNAFIEQAIRSSFNFRRQGINAELLRRVSSYVRVTGRYTLGRTKLFEPRIPEEQRLEVDKLFPQVRLSSFSVSIYRDTRDDPLDPTRGSLIGTDSELAARSIGSQVGFAKAYVQAFAFRRFARAPRVVLAGAARVGLARGFERQVGEGPVITELPASERFFAGGSTTLRGFALDRLGASDTISSTGFAQGGNAMVVLNAEIRAPVWRDLGAVGFLDVGNVFARVSDLDLTELRASPGLGLRYRSPIGPIRFDIGFKLDRRELSPGNFERLTAFHISVGHAF
ncbi:MAG TPA: POTRA domain-containing protein [Vicinamibacterales bacterium]|nr:POTRA domain-containing protein [Vicinamibacterales bacterium]